MLTIEGLYGTAKAVRVHVVFFSKFFRNLQGTGTRHPGRICPGMYAAGQQGSSENARLISRTMQFRAEWFQWFSPVGNATRSSCRTPSFPLASVPDVPDILTRINKGAY